MPVEPIEVVEGIDVIRIEPDRKRERFWRVGRVVVGELMEIDKIIVVIQEEMRQPNWRRYGHADHFRSKEEQVGFQFAKRQIIVRVAAGGAGV